MDELLFIGIAIIIVILLSYFLGRTLAKIIMAKRDKKLIKELNDVLEGKKENTLEAEGNKYPAERFILRNEEGEEFLMDLKGGKQIIKNENKKIKEERIKVKDVPIARKDSRSVGKEKRTTRTGHGGRIRRFG